MEGWHLIAAMAGGPAFLVLLAYLALQWRLHQRDRRDHQLRLAVLAVNPKAPVLQTLAELRRAEREVSLRLPVTRGRGYPAPQHSVLRSSDTTVP